MPSQNKTSFLNSAESCINVVIDNCRREQPNDATYRPDLPSEPTHGDHFEPLKMPYREPCYKPLPPTALGLVQTFLPEALVSRWVIYTNLAALEAAIEGWSPVSLSEIYIWIALLIYMGIHKESSFKDYWKAPTVGGFDPTHPITKLMPYSRFQQLRVRLRICALAHTQPHTHDAFDCIDEWSSHL